MRRFLILSLLCLCALSLNAQKRRAPIRSYTLGTFYGYWGYNRSYYTKSDLHFVGTGYDFNLKGSVAKDNPSYQFKQYVNPTTITVPQFNARIGYYFKNQWAISLGYDHMKYVYQNGNNVLLSGKIEPGADDVTFGAGTYSDFPVTTDTSTFHYENSNGLNYIRTEIIKTNLLYTKKWFELTSNVGLGTGVLLSFNDFKFAGQKDRVTISLSGLAVSAHADLRFEFGNHFFVRTGLSAGYMNQLHVKTRPDDDSAYARHQYGYAQMDMALGFNFILYDPSKCNTCPHF